ncbi:hypothetical protein DSO57_1038387 [Entomophthora muscae]|uniref:Uncharacterized protein n=1 Tax=Entomophthora muscae TaxID=34485 RepID=A0ACC2SN18_9FUNG|nr:hypothetical protein DSO57_1038387 [Entomophthora muscae]
MRALTSQSSGSAPGPDAPLFEPSSQRPNLTTGSPRASTGGLFRDEQSASGPDSQRLRPVQLEPEAIPARAPSMATDSPRMRGNLDQEGIRLIPQPLASYNNVLRATQPPTPPNAAQSPPSASKGVWPFSLSDMSTSTQALYVLAAFILLQGIKIADFRNANSTEHIVGWGMSIERTTRLAKWMLGDGFFLALVKYLKVPNINYPSNLVFVILFFTLASLDMLLLYSQMMIGLLIKLILPFGTYIPGYYNVTSAPITKVGTTLKLPESRPRSEELEIGLGSQKELSREGLLLESSHLLGKYTVKILPDSISKMNPDGLSFCLNQLPDGSYDGPVYIPVYINGTDPFKLHYTLTTLKGKQLPLRDIILARFARNHLVDKDSKLVSGTYMLQAEQPGRYTLNGIYAHEDYVFRQSPDFREVVVAPCPRASFMGPATPSVIPFCLGQKPVELNIEAKGISPFLVSYARQVNSSDIIVRVPGDKPWARDGVLPLEEVTQKIPIDTDIQKPGLYKYRVDSIEDRFNNKAQYNETATTTRAIRAHMLPTIHTSCDAAIHYSLSPKTPKARIDVKLSGIAPFSVVLGICTGSEEAITASCFVEHTRRTFSSSKASFEVSTPGHYRILALSDGNCHAALAAGPSCVVAKVPPPTLQVKHEPIVSSCQFEVGLQATLLMTGQPPFLVSYREHVTFKNGKKRTTEKQVVSKSLQHHFEIIPEESGTYAYEFHTLSSDNYGAVETNHTLHQVVHAQPSARFTSRTQAPARVCTGLPISPSLAKIHFSGIGPWTLDYTIFHNDQVIERSLANISNPELSLPLDTMHSTGRYVVQLTRTSDGSNCHHKLDDAPLIIEARSLRPSAEFQCGPNNTIYSLRHQEATLPISVSGEGPWELSLLPPSSQNETFVLERSGDGLVAEQEGLYELLGIKDSYCPGSILEKSTCQVKWHPEPALLFPPQVGLSHVSDTPRYIRDGVCQGVASNIALELTGRSPWDLAYTLNHPAVSHLPLELGAEQPNATGRLALDTMSPGLHTYTFHTVGDYFYKQHKPDPALILEQEVFPRPAAWFLSDSPLHLCADQQVEDIELSLEGQAPFEVILEWRTAGAPPHQEFIQDITQSPHRFSLAGRPPGMHSLRVVQVNDANGCMGGPDLSIDADRPAVLRVEVVAPPTLQPISLAARRLHACVGDRLAYSLGGVSPWEVHYSVNDTLRKADQKEPSFRRLIDAPGTFQISRVCHLPGSGCCAPPPPGLGQVVIHPLPGALIAGGADQFVHIHDGEHKDVVVDLIGTPPFQFTYTRRSVATHELLETLTVYSVPTNMHQLDISLEGIFEIVAVRDQFCQYPVPPNLVDLDENIQ